MKRVLLLVALLAVVWPSASSAPAHTLTQRTAEAKARSEAYLISGMLRSRPAIHVQSSRAVSRHVVRVAVRFRFRDRSRTCRIQRMRVRFAGNRTQRLTVALLLPAERC